MKVGNSLNNQQESLDKVGTGLKNGRIGLLIALIAAVVLAPTATAIDINSSKALKYYGDGNNIDFEVQTDSETEISGIANFTNSQISFYEPLSLQSSGPLSVANGIDLTGSSSNTIDSYSTFYLQTSSGSPSDIVLDPTGDVGVQANLSTSGDIDVNDQDLNDVSNIYSDDSDSDFFADCSGSSNYIYSINSDGTVNCASDSTGSDSQDLSTNNASSPSGASSVSHGVQITGGDDAAVKDYYVPDSDTQLGENTVEQYIFDTGDNNQGDLGLNGNAIQDTSDNEVDINDDAAITGNLDVNSPSSTGATLDVGGTARIDSGQTLDFGDINWQIQDDTSNNRLDFQDRIGTNTDVVRLKNGGNVEIPNGNLKMSNNQVDGINQLDFNGGASIDEGTADYGSIRLTGGEAGSSYGGINVEGNRDVVVGMTDADGSGFSTGAYDDDNNNWIWRYDGSNLELRRNGNIKAETQESGFNVRVDGANKDDGIYLDSTAAVTTSGSWLRLNQNNNFGNGIYTPGFFRADGGAQFRGNLDMNSNSIDDINNLYQDDSSTNFFASDCASGNVVAGINSDGTYNCASSSAQVEDIWVNETGDTMSGNLEVNAQMTADEGAFGVSESTGNSELSDSTVYVGGNLEVADNILGRGGDVAENVEAEKELEEGEVAVIGGNMSIGESDEAYDRAVAGVISTDPGVTLAEERDGKPLALTGIVPVKVTVENGKIRPGDRLTVSDKPGTAMKCKERRRCEGAIVGKAMEPAEQNGKINVLLTMG